MQVQPVWLVDETLPQCHRRSYLLVMSYASSVCHKLDACHQNFYRQFLLTWTKSLAKLTWTEPLRALWHFVLQGRSQNTDSFLESNSLASCGSRRVLILINTLRLLVVIRNSWIHSAPYTSSYFNIDFNNFLHAMYTVLEWRWAPQQTLRAHRSLKGYCASLWWRWLLLFCSFSSNGAPVEWNWQGKTEVLWEKPVPVPLYPPQISHGLTRDRNRASAVGGRRLTAWAMARPTDTVTMWCISFRISHLLRTWYTDSLSCRVIYAEGREYKNPSTWLSPYPFQLCLRTLLTSLFCLHVNTD
jgi:hypothetical protein